MRSAWWGRILVCGSVVVGACSSGTRMQPVLSREPPDSLAQAVSLRNQGRHEAAAQEIERVLALPSSPSLAAEAQWELYVTHRESGRSGEALEALVSCATAGSPSPWIDQQLRAHIGRAVVAAVDGGVGWPRVQSIIQPLGGSMLLLDVVSSLLDDGHCRAASTAISRVDHVADAGRAAQHRDLLRRVSRCLGQRGRTLGLVVPLSGEYAEYGISLYRGATLAVTDTMVLAFRVEDSRSDPVDEVLAVERLAAMTDVIAVIGPLQSRAATGAAVAATHGGLPLLAPLSAPSGLNRLGSWVFQSAAPLQGEAKAVARWGLLEAGISRLAVLYPSQTSGERAMEAFRDQVLALGGDIVALEQYAQGRDTNFRNQIVNLKRAAPQAVFVPGEPRELVQIARQIAFYDLQCTLLGTSGWGDAEVIADAGRLVEGVIFADRIETGKNERQALLFSAQYHDRYGGDPDQYATLGYDLAGAVWDAVNHDAVSREDLRMHLTSRGAYQGVSGVVNWQRDDAPHDVRLYTIRGGLVIPLHPR